MQISKTKYKEFKDELLKLQAEILPKRKQELADAISDGDGQHDSPVWQSADANFSQTLERVTYLEDILRTAEIIEVQPSDKVVQGSKATVKDDLGSTQTYEIVSELEVDPRVRKISIQSPLGSLLMGKKVHDHIVFNGKTLKITKIN